MAAEGIAQNFRDAALTILATVTAKTALSHAPSGPLQAKRDALLDGVDASSRVCLHWHPLWMRCYLEIYNVLVND